MAQLPRHALRLCAVALVACGGGGEATESGTTSDSETQQSAGDDSTTLRGMVELWTVRPFLAGFDDIGEKCDGAFTMPDLGGKEQSVFSGRSKGLETGTQVHVRNEEGTTVGVGELRRGVWVFLKEEREMVCQMTFSAEVGTATFYEVQVGDESVTFPADDVARSIKVEVRDR